MVLPSDPAEGPLTRVVDPLVGRLVGGVPLWVPVRGTVRVLTRCGDEVVWTVTTHEAGTGCPVPAS